jgi:DNA-binding response OmpR family regulator/class 3 adenylate cyclase/predicted ATPase
MGAGHRVEVAESDKHAREVLAGGDVAIALLATQGLGGARMALIRELHGAGVKTILLSERPEEIGSGVRPPLNPAIGLSLPLDREVVLTAVATVLDAVTTGVSASTLAPEITRFEGLTLDIEGRSAFDAAGRELPLTRLEFALLAVFARQPGRALSRDQLVEAVSGRRADKYDRSIDVLVTRLRRKIEPAPKKPYFVVTVPGVGYKFAAKPRLTHQQPTMPSADGRLGPARPRIAERRLLTIVWCHFPELATLSMRLDPEDLQAIIAGYRQCCEGVAARYEGSPARFLNDGVVLHFGYPQAHEDDAQSAVQAGLDILDCLARPGIDHRNSFGARIAIATGVVLVRAGDADGIGGEMEAIGEAPNLASRLISATPPGALLIDASTRRLVGNLFELRRLVLDAADGSGEPIPAWQVTRQSPAIGRFEALRGPSLSPLVGRQEEMELLLRRWNRAAAGDGQLVLIAGEAGIGKSRIASALQEQLDDKSYLPIGYFCSSHHGGSPFYPIARQIEFAAGFTPEDDVGIKLAKLSDWLGSTFTKVELALLCELLSLPAAEHSAEIRDVAAQRKREKTLQALNRLIESRAQRQPVLLTFEDVQWIDPTSRELLDTIIERIRRLPVLLLVTYRPEFQTPWSGQSHVTMLTLNRLSPHDSAALIGQIGGDVVLPDDVIADIAERTDGIPLFIEELTRAILESGEQSRGIAHMLSTSPSPPLGVPATLHSSLMARLDRLGNVAKEAAHIGAVLGREFGYELLRGVSECSEAELKEALERLTEARIVWCRGTAPFSHYTFRHTLLQEAAYATLLRVTRQLLHSRAADALISRTDDDASAGPEVVANHLQLAGRSDDAIPYWRRAGERAVQRAANREAVGHLQRALSLLDVQPETAERRRAELSILLQLGPALMSLHGWWASEVGATIERASEVARGLKSSADLAPSIANLWSFNIARGRYDRAEENSRDLFRIARELDDPEIMLQAHHTAQGNLALRGEFAAASEHIDAALSLYDAERHAHHRYVYLGHDPSICMRALGAVMRSVLGYPDAAMRGECGVLAAARRLEHPPSLAQALWFVSESQSVRGDAPAVWETATELLKLSEEHGLPQPRSFALIFLGWALARSGQTSEGISCLADGLGALGKMGGRMHLTRSHCLMAESLLAAGRYAEGLEQVTRGLDVAAEIGEQWYLSRLHHVHAELLLQVNGPRGETAEASLHQARAVARRQRARGWELRACMSLARLWVDHGRHIDARRLLAPLYGRLATEVDAPDLNETKELLDSLS